MLINTIAICPKTPDLYQKACDLATQLSLPLTETEDTTYSYLLLLSHENLSLKKMGCKMTPFVIDFFDKTLQYRIKQASIKKEAIARAMGLKSHTSPLILDTTAGLGRDSFLLASLGFQVQMLERSPIIHALLKNAIVRAAALPAIQKMHLTLANAITWLNESTEKPDIIYLDPMFPERKKTALPKQSMLIFHDIVGDDLDASLLLTKAIACATKRVVVKRPRLATNISAHCAPSFSLTGSSNRFDVYLI